MNPTETKKSISFAGGSELPQIGTEAYTQAQQGVKPEGFNGAITSDSLAPTTPINLPPTPTTSIASSVAEIALASGKRVTAEQQAQETQRQAEADRLAKAESEKTKAKWTLSSIFGEKSELGQKKIEAQQNAGIPQKQKQVNQLTSSIEAQQLALSREVEAIEKQTGLTAGQKDLEIRNLTREASRKMADDGILLNALNRDLLTAQTLVNQKIELETEDLKNRADYFKFIYEDAKATGDKEFEREAARLTKEADREYEQGKETQKFISNLQLKLAENDGVPSDIYSKIAQEKDPNKAIAIASPYLKNTSNEIVKVGESAYLIDKKTGKIIESYGEKVVPEGGVQLKDMGGDIVEKVGNLRAIVGDTKPKQQAFDAGLESAKARGAEAVERYVTSQYVNKVLSGTQKEDFSRVNSSIDNYDLAIQFLKDNPDLNLGFYTSTKEGLKPKAAVDKNQKYVTFANLINQAEQPIRKSQFGAALTDTELGLARTYLWDPADDRNSTLTKMGINRAINYNTINKQMATDLGTSFDPVPVPGLSYGTDSFLSQFGNTNLNNQEFFNQFNKPI